MKIDKRKIILSVIIVILGLLVYGVQKLRNSRQENSIQLSEETSESADIVANESFTEPVGADITLITNASISETFPVYICGGIRIPGVYEIQTGMYLYELIELAGGLCDNAAIENIDMVYRVDHAQSIYIPILEISDSSRSWNDFSQVRTSSWNEGGETPSTDEGLININTCSVSELCVLPGIGEKTAARIIEYRQEHGDFKRKEDLCQVPGIGDVKYSSIKDLICV